jgi:hypothetical protein
MSTHRLGAKKVGVWSARERRDWFADDARRSCTGGRDWAGQHIELGIEVQSVALRTTLGATRMGNLPRFRSDMNRGQGRTRYHELI